MLSSFLADFELKQELISCLKQARVYRLLIETKNENLVVKQVQQQSSQVKF